MTQTACCRGDTPALDVYRNYKWYGKENTCATDLGVKECEWSAKFDTSLVSSWSGSGAQVCYNNERERGARPLCEDTRDVTKPHFTNCDWSDDLNLGLTDIVSEGQCSGNCPSGKVKVTLESLNNKCGKGTSAYCCDVGASFDYTDIDNDDMEDLIKEWVKNPTCPKLSGPDENELSSRSVNSIDSDVDDQSSDLIKRQGLHTLTPDRAIVLIVRRLMELPQDSRATRDLRKLVDKYFVAKWPHITGTYIAEMLWSLRDKIPTLVAARNFICNMDAEEDYAKNHPKKKKGCDIPSLDTYDPSSLQQSHIKPSDADIKKTFGSIDRLVDPKWPWNEMKWSLEWINGGLAKRAAKRRFKLKCPDGTPWEIQSFAYPNGDNGDKLEKSTGDPKRYWVDNINGDCFNALVMHSGAPTSTTWISEHIIELRSVSSTTWISEHIIELRSVSMFMEWTMGIKNRLKDRESPSGLAIERPFNPDGDIPCTVWIDDFQNGFFRWNNNHQDTPQNTIFKLLGSTSNTKHVVNAEAKFNGIKGLLWGFNEPVSGTTWDLSYAATDDTTVKHALEQLMLVEQVFSYLKKPDVEEKLMSAHSDVIELLNEFEELYRAQHNSGPLSLSDMWRNFMRELLDKMQGWTKTWLTYRISEMKKAMVLELDKRERRYQAVSGTPLAAAALESFVEAGNHWSSLENHETGYSSLVERFDPDIFLTI